MIRAEKKSLFLLITVTFAVVVFYFLLQGKYLFASNVDWIAQHSVFPDYFRKIFYQTAEIYPDFAIQIGGGQNIFNFGYYGLLNPCILLSYFSPFIEMNNWLMGVSFCSLIASVCLFYNWLRHKDLSRESCLWTALIFMLSGPLIYHSYVQIMFVNYMPFLLLALLATDRYFAQGRRGMLIVSVLFMILTSFYFSVGGLACLCLYALYCYFKKAYNAGFISKKSLLLQNIKLRNAIKELFFAAVRYLSVLLHGVLLSSFYLLPVAYALFRGRSGNGSAKLPSAVSLFNPFSSLSRFLYEPYGIGLSMLAVIALITGCFSKKLERKILSFFLITVTSVPLFTYLLNGGLYDSAKVLIPFVPLFCFSVALFVEELDKRQLRGTEFFIALILIPAILFLLEKSRYWPVYFFDWLLCLGAIALSIKAKHHGKTKCFRILFLQAALVLFLSGSLINKKANMALDAADLQPQKEIAQLVEQTVLIDDSAYRMDFYAGKRQNFQNINRIYSFDQKISSVYSSTYNRAYKNFRETIIKVEKPNRNTLMLSAVENDIFRQIMGIKYIISDRQPVGYEKVISGQSFNVYRNESVAPLAYGTTQTLSKKEYETLEFPYNQLALAAYAVVDSDLGTVDFKEAKQNLTRQVTAVDSIKAIEGRPQGNYALDFAPPKQDSILFVKFHVDNLTDNRDLKIDFGAARNKLSARNYNYYNENTDFIYALEIKAGQHSLPLTFYEGDYIISNAEAYLAERKAQTSLYEYEWKEEAVLPKRTKNVLAGSINMGEAGYLITSIPFDSFSVTVNGQVTEALQVNEGFLGVQLEKGDNEIIIQYHASGKKAGLLLSVIGVMLAVFISIKKASQKRLL